MSSIIDRFIEAITEPLRNLFSSLANAIGIIFDRVVSTIGMVWNLLVEVIDTLKNYIFSEIRTMVNQLITAIRTVVDSRVEHITQDANAMVDALRSFLESPFRSGESKFARAMYRSIMSYALARMLRKGIEGGLSSAIKTMFIIPLIYEFSRSMEPYILNVFANVAVGHGQVPVQPSGTAPLPDVGVRTPGMPPRLEVTLPLDVTWGTDVKADVDVDAKVVEGTVVIWRSSIDASTEMTTRIIEGVTVRWASPIDSYATITTRLT
ncbi:MAG: hypothetical protein QW669_04415, partial [Desulfurococcaceae archaeon]